MCTLSLVLGFCIFLTTIISDLENDISDLNDDLILLNDSVWNEISHDDVKLKFIKIIQFYSDAKMLVQI